MRVEGRDGGESNEGSKVPSQLRLGMESTFGPLEHSQANQLAMPVAGELLRGPILPLITLRE
jgi:hypothetical protein